MLKNRIIGCVLVKNGIAVQSIGFRKFLPIGKAEIAVEFLSDWDIDEIVVLNKRSGKPYICVIGQTKKILIKKFKKKKSKISLSLSDEKKYAVAFVTISI